MKFSELLIKLLYNLLVLKHINDYDFTSNKELNLITFFSLFLLYPNGYFVAMETENISANFGSIYYRNMSYLCVQN